MEEICQRLICSSRSTLIKNTGRRIPIGIANRRTISTTNNLQARKKIKPPSKQPQRQELEYKTPTRKPPPPHNPTSTSPRRNPLRDNQFTILVLSASAIGISGYCTYLYVALTREPSSPAPTTAATQEDVSSRYNIIASEFDDHISLTEKMMGINSLRKKLISHAHGDVLEVSIGTGRNLEYFDWDFKGHNGVGKADHSGRLKKGKVRSFTAVDKSGEMLEIAHEKFTDMFPGILGVRWVIGDAAEKGVIPGPPKNANERSGNLSGKKYDTVIQTMGLCSVDDPVALLRNLGEVVEEESGRILLLEHGRGKWEWLNGVLDRFAEGHAKQFGCWWNRDFESVIRECGLEVVKVERPKWFHGGTTWWIELKKPKVSGGEDTQVSAVSRVR